LVVRSIARELSRDGAEVDRLLSESITDCFRRERDAFDTLATHGGQSIVLFGAGRLGRQTLRGLREVGRSPVAFSDNAEALWGTQIDGIEVLPPATAANRYGGRAAFVVTIWRAGGPHRFEHSRAQLSALGCKYVIPLAVLAWKYAPQMLPHYCMDLPHRVLEEHADVRRALALLGDARSRAEFAAQLRFRLLGDLDSLPHPDADPQYLPAGIFQWRDDEHVVDGGAYDGDTLKSVIAAGRPFRDYVALEPDPVNFVALERYVAALPPSLVGRVRAMPLALYSTRTRMRIQHGGSVSAALAAPTGPELPGDVTCVPLDELCADRPLTFLKLDIEGAELEAIEGARKVIARDRPVIAVCVYHRQNHLWQIPLLIQSIVGGYDYYLRPYNEEGWDLVCYAVPDERVSDAPDAGEPR
jgi:FkbM family methyltransferase